MANKFTLHHGDCLSVLKTLPGSSVDSVVTDPPYGLSFMANHWDYDVPSVEIWAECLRVLKPGGHLLAFAGTRTQHRMAARIEDAGFEIRDMIAWVYGSGFPKSLDVSKAIDKAAGAERKVLGLNQHAAKRTGYGKEGALDSRGPGLGGIESAQITAPSTDAAIQWQGWGTALKPALEPITVARKPLIGTVAENILAHGTGTLNIDGCRVPHGGEADGRWGNGTRPGGFCNIGAEKGNSDPCGQFNAAGRWPSNLIHDGSEEVLAAFPQKITKSTGGKNSKGGMGKRVFGSYALDRTGQNAGGIGDEGTPARFFYCAKASKADRGADNVHPTVKPTDLMRYLCRLVTPPGGVILDPFMGSGSTGKGAMLEGFRFIGIEREAEYINVARARIEAVNESFIAAGEQSKPDGQFDLFGRPDD